MNFGKTEKTFYFDYTTKLGNRYEGNFTVKCLLNIGEKHKLELEKARLLGNSNNPTSELIGISIVLANLRAKIIDAPNWWTQSQSGANLYEEDVLSELFTKVDDMELEWRKELMDSVKTSTDPLPQT